MLENVLSNNPKPYSYLTSNVTATTTVMGPTGLVVYLAANTNYCINCKLWNVANGDGMQNQLIFSGASAPSGIIYWSDVIAAAYEPKAINGSAFGYTTTDGVIEASGILRTASAGRLLVYYGKITDATDDSQLLAGSYLVATQL